MPARKDLPSTLQRSPEKAQRTWAETHDSAVEEYGEGERAHRTAYSALTADATERTSRSDAGEFTVSLRWRDAGDQCSRCCR